MKLWQSEEWKNFYKDGQHRTGLHVRYESGVDPEVKRAIGEYVAWLRSQYEFPKRLRLYVKRDRRIRATDGSLVCSTFFRPADRNSEPYIRAATGDYAELLQKWGKDNALAAQLSSIARMITHYYQWLNDVELTLIGEDRQAAVYAKASLTTYAQTRDHP